MNIIYLSAIFFSLSSYASLTETLSKEVPSECKLTKETKYFKKKIAGRKFIIRHILKCPNQQSYLYLDNHTVRTMNEVILVEIKEKSIKKIKTLKFYEPPEYKASSTWLKRLIGRTLETLSIGNELDAISGATITSHAIVENVAKLLKIHHSIENGKTK